MLFVALPSSMVAAVCWFSGCGPASTSASASASAPASQEQPAAAPQEKPVAAAADSAIETMKKFIAEQKVDTSKAGWKTKLTKPPLLTFDPKKTYYWVMETNKGTMKIKLNPDVAPMHVSSCIYLNTLGFYDGLKFHRVLKGFMAQGGCPNGNGGGSPGYQMTVERKPDVTHSKLGILSTARSDNPDTDGSQFFLTFAPARFLDTPPGYTIYGEISDGLEVLSKIEACGRDRGFAESRSNPATPSEELLIIKGTIEVK